MMRTPEQVVSDFLAMWDAPGGFSRAMAAYFTEATVYENVGMSKTTGLAEAAAFGEGFEAQVAGGVLRAETLTSAAIGNRVLNERIDHMVDGSGKTLHAFRVMGIFEVEGDKITAWRDYFDTAGLAQSMAACQG